MTPLKPGQPFPLSRSALAPYTVTTDLSSVALDQNITSDGYGDVLIAGRSYAGAPALSIVFNPITRVTFGGSDAYGNLMPVMWVQGQVTYENPQTPVKWLTMNDGSNFLAGSSPLFNVAQVDGVDGNTQLVYIADSFHVQDVNNNNTNICSLYGSQMPYGDYIDDGNTDADGNPYLTTLTLTETAPNVYSVSQWKTGSPTLANPCWYSFSTRSWTLTPDATYGGVFSGRASTAQIATTALQIQSQTPAHNNSTGTAGQIKYDANYLYVCKATNSWARIAWTSTSW